MGSRIAPHLTRLGLTLLLALSASSLWACEKSVRWSVDPPFAFRRADGEISGLTVDVLRETLARMGCRVRLVEMPWARALAELETGRLDILPGTVRLPERERFAHFSKPGLQSRNIVFVRGETLQRWPLKHLDELRSGGFRLGAQLGVAFGPEFQSLLNDPGFAASVHRVPNRRSLWLMLAAGRLDGVLTSEWSGEAEIAALGLQGKILNSGLVVPHAQASVAFSRQSVDEAFVARYDQVTEAMQKDGSMATLLQRYAQPKFKPPAPLAPLAPTDPVPPRK
jgi:polar amino acid transport system substrate-binding protein